MTYVPRHRSMIRSLILFLAGLAALASAATSSADTIVLKSNVRLADDLTVVLLRDVAHLEGDAARRLAETKVGELGMQSSVTLTLDQVRSALLRVTPSASLIDFSGNTVVVRSAKAGKPVAMRPLAVDTHAPRTLANEHASPAQDDATRPDVSRIEFFADEVNSIRTPRGLIAEMLRNVHANRQARLRLVITGVDNAFLDQVSSTRRFEVVPLNPLTADVIKMRVIARDGDTAVDRTMLTVVPTLEARVATAKGAVRRGAALGDNVAVETLYVAPSEFDSLASPEALDTVVTADHLRKGERLTDDKLRRPIEVKKNEKVTIRRELGAVAVELVAIAEEDGAVGDIIRFRAIDRKDRRDRRTFAAEVVARGQAVIRDTDTTLARGDS